MTKVDTDERAEWMAEERRLRAIEARMDDYEDDGGPPPNPYEEYGVSPSDFYAE